MTLAARALTQLATWPDLTVVEPSCGTGRALASAHGEIAHFHSGQDVDLHLTVRIIRRFEEHLTGAPAVRLTPGSQWVTLHLDVAADIDLLMTLVSLALQAHQAWPVPGDGPRTPCNDQHFEASRMRISAEAE
ncbi:luciferase family protein [Streptomyces sp. NPDC006446]|uniref:luciferase domain-containing protein n=1 Tax=Streptomyces sp. NPDC006446 TaxID=3154301 RepID=UPI0033BAA551